MENIVFIALIFIANTFSTIVGFGLNSIALPFLNLMFDVKFNIVVLLFLNLLNGMLVLIDRKNIDWKKLSTIILYMLIGLPFGLTLFYIAPSAYLKLGLGIFMIFAGCWGILKAKVTSLQNIDIGKIPARISLIFGGIAQGAIASAGPFVVLFADRELTDKKKFRTTLMMMWVLINFIQIFQYTLTGMVTTQVAGTVLIGVIPLFVGMWLGFQVSKKVNRTTFSIILNSIITFAGIINIYAFFNR